MCSSMCRALGADFLLRGMDDANRLMPYFFDEAAADELIARLTLKAA